MQLAKTAGAGKCLVVISSRCYNARRTYVVGRDKRNLRTRSPRGCLDISREILSCLEIHPFLGTEA